MCSYASVAAQNNTLPDFNIVTTAGKQMAVKTVAAKKTLVLIYFAPDCDHCITLINNLLPNMPAFAKAQLLLVSFKPMAEVLNFERKFAMNRFSNVVTAVEARPLFLQAYYKLKTTPYTAVYNKQGYLIKSFGTATEVIDLLKTVKQAS